MARGADNDPVRDGKRRDGSVRHEKLILICVRRLRRYETIWVAVSDVQTENRKRTIRTEKNGGVFW